MAIKFDYDKKFKKITDELSFDKLPQSEQEYIKEKSHKFFFTFQDIRILIDISLDLVMWGHTGLNEVWPTVEIDEKLGHEHKNLMIDVVREKWLDLKWQKKDYKDFKSDHKKQEAIKFLPANNESKILGRCPVASEKTRCCNLLTLDAARNCGFDCSYCCIQTYFHDNTVYIETNLKEKIKNLKLNKDEIYHIGTGQSSDSLMWGNKDGILDALMEFARENPNVILELKTKSNNVSYLLENDIPKNVICSWTLNTDTIIENEEHLTSTLSERLKAARKIADKGILVGFHFHPMIYYLGWDEEYKELFEKTVSMFQSDEVVMVSFGTLTYIKSVINKIRRRDIKSKVLQMPFEEIAGKYSYPFQIKREMFSLAYDSFKDWHKNVFFYLCMEDINIWGPVFDREYRHNDDFEEDMKKFYISKITKEDD